MDHETAGDPVRGLRWTRRTTAKVAAELCKLGTDICARTVARLLKKMGFSLRVNHKKRAGASHPNRDDQFHHIAEVRERCAVDNTPVISVDTKKKELVGAFRNPGAKWDHSPELVNDHDFRSDAEGRAIPYGIYDTRANAVRAHRVRKTYKTGVKVTDAQMQELRITPDSSLPKWNYTIEPM